MTPRPTFSPAPVCRFGFINGAPDGADSNHTENYADGGFTFLVNEDLQLDVRGSVGLNDAAVDYFVGTGFVLRH